MDRATFRRYCKIMVSDLYPTGAADSVEQRSNRERKLVIFDQLDAHTDKISRRFLYQQGVDTIYTPERLTPWFQAADAGKIAATKSLKENFLEAWLDADPANFDLWETDMSAKERRILVTKIFGAIYRANRAKEQARL